MLAQLNAQYNFLKHADRDSAASMAEHEFDAPMILDRTCVLYEDLFPNHRVEEIIIYKYLLQRKQGAGFSEDASVYRQYFDKFDETGLKRAALSYLCFAPDRE